MSVNIITQYFVNTTVPPAIIEKYMTDFPRIYRMGDPAAVIPDRMQKDVEKYAKKFNVSFSTLFYFTPAVFANLHDRHEHGDVFPSEVTIVSQRNPAILEEMAVLDRVANSPAPTIGQRQRYRAALEAT